MTPEQALQLIDGAAAQANGNRKDHEIIKEAAATLAKYIDDTKPKAPPEPAALSGAN